MTTLPVDQIYEQQIKPLSRVARWRLLARIATDLAELEEQDVQSNSVLEILNQTTSGKAFQSVEQVAAYLAEERGSWAKAASESPT
jgi:hypothetical protein